MLQAVDLVVLLLDLFEEFSTLGTQERCLLGGLLQGCAKPFVLVSKLLKGRGRCGGIIHDHVILQAHDVPRLTSLVMIFVFG